ncbi:MAG: hypothetical protein IT581_06440 [Verrucomicrobiales bacterium]|nr:hypothetical protein [Verrucomicrobiales bacterium]
MRIALPMAFEAERPFRLLRKECIAALGAQRGQVVAYFVFVRLWVELGLEARATDRVGYLSPLSHDLWLERIREGLDDQSTDWAEIAIRAGLLERLDGDQGFHCPHFNVDGMNEAARRSHQGAQQKGGIFGSHARRRTGVQREAEELALTLLPAADQSYSDMDGQPLDLPRRTAALALIKTIDNSVKAQPRPAHAANWPPGEVAMADAVCCKYNGKTMNVNRNILPMTDAVALFLLAHHGDPRMPTTTQQALGVFDALVSQAEQYHRPK